MDEGYVVTNDAAAPEDSPVIRVPSIACFWIGVCGFLQIALWVSIMMVRIPKPAEAHHLHNLAEMNNNKDTSDLRVTRAHGNYTENAAIFAVMLVVVDACGVIPESVIEISGFVFVAGRFLHAIGMHASEKATYGRMGGALLTLLSLTNLSVQCLISAYVLSNSAATNSSNNLITNSSNNAILYRRLTALVIAFVVSKCIAGKAVSQAGINSSSNEGEQKPESDPKRI